MQAEYETVLHRWMEEVWNQKNRTGAIKELLSEGAPFHGISGPGGDPIIGPDAFARFHEGLLMAFPDIQIVVNDVIQTEDKLAGRFTVTGTNLGPFNEIPATGKKVRFTGSGIATVRDGKFTEIWNDIDFAKVQYDLAPDTPDVE